MIPHEQIERRAEELAELSMQRMRQRTGCELPAGTLIRVLQAARERAAKELFQEWLVRTSQEYDLRDALRARAAELLAMGGDRARVLDAEHEVFFATFDIALQGIEFSAEMIAREFDFALASQ